MFGFHRAFVKRLAAAPGRVNCDFNHTRVRLCGAQQDQTKHACFGKDANSGKTRRNAGDRATPVRRGALRLSVKVRATNRGAGSDQEATPCLKQPPAHHALPHLPRYPMNMDAEATDRPLVLIVDDDEEIRSALQELLLSVGIDACCFGSTQELLNADLPERPGCLILDVRLPGASGLDLQQRISASNGGMTTDHFPHWSWRYRNDGAGDEGGSRLTS